MSEVAQSCPTLCDPMDYIVHQAPPSSRQEYWSGLPFPSPGNLPDPRIEPRSPALQADALTSEPPGNIMQNAGQNESQARIKTVVKNINSLRYAADIILMAESEEELKSRFMKVK